MISITLFCYICKIPFHTDMFLGVMEIHIRKEFQWEFQLLVSVNLGLLYRQHQSTYHQQQAKF